MHGRKIFGKRMGRDMKRPLEREITAENVLRLPTGESGRLDSGDSRERIVSWQGRESCGTGSLLCGAW